MEPVILQIQNVTVDKLHNVESCRMLAFRCCCPCLHEDNKVYVVLASLYYGAAERQVWTAHCQSALPTDCRIADARVVLNECPVVDVLCTSWNRCKFL